MLDGTATASTHNSPVAIGTKLEAGAAADRSTADAYASAARAAPRTGSQRCGA